MKRWTYSIPMVFAVSFALVLGFGSFNVVKAVPGTSGERDRVITSDVNQVGDDAAKNSIKVTDKNADSNGSGRARDKNADSKGSTFTPDVYGLGGTLRP